MNPQPARQVLELTPEEHRLILAVRDGDVAGTHAVAKAIWTAAEAESARQLKEVEKERQRIGDIQSRATQMTVASARKMVDGLSAAIQLINIEISDRKSSFYGGNANPHLDSSMRVYTEGGEPDSMTNMSGREVVEIQYRVSEKVQALCQVVKAGMNAMLSASYPPNKTLEADNETALIAGCLANAVEVEKLVDSATNRICDVALFVRDTMETTLNHDEDYETDFD